MTEADYVRIASDWGRFILSGIVGGSLAAWATLARRDTAAAEFLRKIDTRLAVVESHPPGPDCQAHKARMSALEIQIGKSLGQADIVRTHERIDKLTQSVGEISGTVHRIECSVDMMSQHLLAHGPRTGDRHP